MKNRTFIRILSFAFAGIIVAIGFYIKENNNSKKYKLQLQNEYSKALSELDSRLNNISVILQKTIYVTGTPQLSAFATELYSEAELAKSALSELPSGTDNLNTVYRFLSQVGNYALSVSKSYAKNNEVTEEQLANLTTLSKTANQIARAVGDIQISKNNGDFWTATIEDTLESIDQKALADSLTELEENLTDFPTLIYDGPYSDHILNKKPLMTSNATSTTSGDALDIARNFILDDDKSLKYDGMQNGKIKSYRFTDENTDITVSEKGGYVVYLRKHREIGDTSFNYNRCLNIAKKFLSDNGYDNMKDTYYYSDEGICVINFAYLDGQTICYTDLIKVGVALDNSEIMFFESSGYLTNHTARAFETLDTTIEQAAEKINKNLNVKEVAMTLIPTDGGAEVRCYEFLCKTIDNNEVLVYINAKTLITEQIFFLLKTDGGTLVK